MQAHSEMFLSAPTQTLTMRFVVQGCEPPRLSRQCAMLVDRVAESQMAEAPGVLICC